MIISWIHCVRMLKYDKCACVFSASMNFRLVNMNSSGIFSAHTFRISVYMFKKFLPLFYKIDFNKPSRRQTNMFLNLAWEYKSLTYFFVICFDVSISVILSLCLYVTAEFINDRIGHIIYTFIIVIQLVLNFFSRFSSFVFSLLFRIFDFIH